MLVLFIVNPKLYCVYLLCVIGCVWEHGGNMEHDLIILITCVQRVCPSGIRCEIRKKEKIDIYTVRIIQAHLTLFRLNAKLYCWALMLTLRHLHLMLCSSCNIALRLYSCCSEWVHFLTLVVELCSVFLPALQSHSLPQQVQERVKRRPGTLVVIHVFLCTLSRPAVHHPYFTLEIQLLTWKHTHAYMDQLLNCLSALNINKLNSHIRRRIYLITYVP